MVNCKYETEPAFRGYISAGKYLIGIFDDMRGMTVCKRTTHDILTAYPHRMTFDTRVP